MYWPLEQTIFCHLEDLIIRRILIKLKWMPSSIKNSEFSSNFKLALRNNAPVITLLRQISNSILLAL